MARLFLWLLVTFPLAAVQAQPVSPAQAQSVLTVLQDPQKRADLIQTLSVIARAAPPDAAKPPPAQSASHNLGAALLKQGVVAAHGLDQQVVDLTRHLSGFALLWLWIRHLALNPAARAAALASLARLGMALAVGLAAEWIARWSLRGAGRSLETWAACSPDSSSGDDPPEEDAAHHANLAHAWRLLRLLPVILARLALDIAPVGVFALGVSAVLLSGAAGTPPDPMILPCALAYGAFRLIMGAARMLFCESPRLRLVRVNDANAHALKRWLAWITGLAAFGAASDRVMARLGLYPAACEDVLKLIMLAAHTVLAILVWRSREAVARRIRPRHTMRGPLAHLLEGLAAVWHWIAIAVIMALWVVWAVAAPDGLVRLGHGFAASMLTLMAARLVSIALLGGLYRLLHSARELRPPDVQIRIDRYTPLIRQGVSVLILSLTTAVLLNLWGIGTIGWFIHSLLGEQLLSALSVTWLCLGAAALIWEAADLAIERRLNRFTTDGQVIRSARLRTIRPILRMTVLVCVLTIAGMIILGQIGVNIAPLLAGAGILGVALGFGSQKLVQDLITGLFLLMENAVQIGDLVTVAGVSGTVEYLSIRTIRLRAGDGSMYIIPFSSVSIVTNTHRGVGNAAVSVTVNATEDVGRVKAMLCAIAAGMKQDPALAPLMLGDLDLWGVDQVNGACVTLVGQIVCTDSGRWPVQRAFNERLHQRCREEGITLSIPTQKIVMQESAPPESGAGAHG